MTALSGGGRHRKDGRSPTSPVLERPDATPSGARPEPRSVDQIFPQHGDAARGRELQGTWATFCKERESSVREALGGGRSPPEIAYAVGELVHLFPCARRDADQPRAAPAGLGAARSARSGATGTATARADPE